MPAPTISEVLKYPDQYPQALKDAAKNFYETKLQYTGKAAEAVRLLVANAEELTVDDTEMVAAFTKIIGVRAAAVKASDEAFAIIAGDFPAPTLPPSPAAPPAAPPAPANDNPVVTPAPVV